MENSPACDDSQSGSPPPRKTSQSSTSMSTSMSGRGGGEGSQRSLDRSSLKSALEMLSSRMTTQRSSGSEDSRRGLEVGPSPTKAPGTSLRLKPSYRRRNRLTAPGLAEKVVLDLGGSSKEGSHGSGSMLTPLASDTQDVLNVVTPRSRIANQNRLFSNAWGPSWVRRIFDSCRYSMLRLSNESYRESQKMPARKVRWWQVTLYLLNDIIGGWLILYSGIILGMYGWVTGLVLLTVLWPINIFGAHLLWRCSKIFPGAISIGDLVFYLTRSTLAMWFTFLIVNVTILLTLAAQVKIVASNIYWLALPSYSQQCFIIFLAGTVAILFPLTQLRSLHSLTFINAVNICCMLVFVVILFTMSVLNGRAEGAETYWYPNLRALEDSVHLEDTSSDAPLPAPLLGLDLMFTAYYYQLIVLEIIAEMKDTTQFPKANMWTTPIVLFVALGCASFRYFYQGSEKILTETTNEEIFDSLFDPNDADGVRSVISYVGLILFSVHMLGCCLLRSVILTRSIHLLVNPRLSNKVSWRSQIEWIVISLVVLALAWALNIVVRHTEIMSLVNGTLALITSIVGPVVLYILAAKKTKKLASIAWYEWVVMACILCASLVVVVVYFVRLGFRIANDIAMHHGSGELHMMWNCDPLSNSVTSKDVSG